MLTENPPGSLARAGGQVDGQPLSWLERRGQDPAVLLLHGWGSSAASFTGLLRLSRSPRRLVALDLPGFGESPIGRGSWDTTAYSELVARWASQQLGSPPSLLGHSYGGAIAIRLAAGPTPPDRLLLCSASGIRPDAGGAPTARTRAYRMLRSSTRWLPGRLGSQAREFLAQRFGSADYRAAGPLLRPTLVAAVTEDLSAQAARIDVPTLIIWGARDQELPLEPHAGRLRELISSSELVVLESSGHFPFVDEAGRFARIFDSFMDARL
jgi:pimeloyl-ACP methyl ester carboxylesterase